MARKIQPRLLPAIHKPAAFVDLVRLFIPDLEVGCVAAIAISPRRIPPRRADRLVLAPAACFRSTRIAG